jgi:hypothetical protein
METLHGPAPTEIVLREGVVAIDSGVAPTFMMLTEFAGAPMVDFVRVKHEPNNVVVKNHNTSPWVRV